MIKMFILYNVTQDGRASKINQLIELKADLYSKVIKWCSVYEGIGKRDLYAEILIEKNIIDLNKHCIL